MDYSQTLAQVFSCEFVDIYKNTFFTERLWVTAFVYASVRVKASQKYWISLSKSDKKFRE